MAGGGGGGGGGWRVVNWQVALVMEDEMNPKCDCLTPLNRSL